MNRVLILFAHPRFERSKTNRMLLDGTGEIAGVTLNDLYEEYPDFNINVERERALLQEHDTLVWHHPFYMYSAPALMKQWMDVVLEHGWARGSKGNAVKGKTALNAITVGGTRQVYARGALHRHTIREFLVPFEQSADLCKMKYLPPFVVHGTHLLTDIQHRRYAAQYYEMISQLIAGTYDFDDVHQFEYFNDWLEMQKGQS